MLEVLVSPLAELVDLVMLVGLLISWEVCPLGLPQVDIGADGLAVLLELTRLSTT